MMAMLEAERKPSVRRGSTEAEIRGMEKAEPYTHDFYTAFVAEYPQLRTELTSEGELIIMPSTFTANGRRNVKLSARPENWSEATNSGETFDSSTIFTLPNGAKRSPDTYCVERARWNKLSLEDQVKRRCRNTEKTVLDSAV